MGVWLWGTTLCITFETLRLHMNCDCFHRNLPQRDHRALGVAGT